MDRDPEFLAECRALRRAVTPFPTLQALRASAEWPALDSRIRGLLGNLRRGAPLEPASPAEPGDSVKAVHWNVEHGNSYGQIEEALLRHEDLRDADLLLFNEIDLGMARSENRDVTADLARALNFHWVWSPLFLETSLGRDDDVRRAGGRENLEALFGLGLISRWPIGEVRAVELPSPERYQFELERMVGRHVALVAVIERPGAPFVAVTVHLEVHRTRAHRAAQMKVVTKALAGEQRPIVLAGDFNSHTFDRGRVWDPFFGAAVLMFAPERALEHRLLFPDHGPTREALFDELKRSGFEWDRLADRVPTLRLRLDRVDELHAFPGFLQKSIRAAMAKSEGRGRLRLDWFATRGWTSGRGFTVRGLDGPGKASDHAPIAAELW